MASYEEIYRKAVEVALPLVEHMRTAKFAKSQTGRDLAYNSARAHTEALAILSEHSQNEWLHVIEGLVKHPTEPPDDELARELVLKVIG